MNFNEMTVEQRGQYIRDLLVNNHCEVTFTKVDGTVRVMPCTLQAGLLPPAPVTENKKERKTNTENISVWCTDKSQWRSFKIANVTDIKIL